MKKTILFILLLLAFILLHLGVNSLLPDSVRTSLLIAAHAFLILITVGGYFGIVFFESVQENSIGIGFLAFSTIKMLFSAGFIALAVLKFKEGIPFVLNFMVIYFVYLAIIAGLLYKLVTDKNKEKQQQTTEV